MPASPKIVRQAPEGRNQNNEKHKLCLISTAIARHDHSLTLPVDSFRDHRSFRNRCAKPHPAIQYTSARQPSRMCNADSGCLSIVIILLILNFDCVCHGVRCSIVQCSAHMPRITRCDEAATEFDEGIMLVQCSTESSFFVRDFPAGRWQDTCRLLPAAAESAYL